MMPPMRTPNAAPIRPKNASAARDVVAAVVVAHHRQQDAEDQTDHAAGQQERREVGSPADLGELAHLLHGRPSARGPPFRTTRMPRHPARDRLTRPLPGALSGVLAAVAGIAVGHLVAGFARPRLVPRARGRLHGHRPHADAGQGVGGRPVRDAATSRSCSERHRRHPAGRRGHRASSPVAAAWPGVAFVLLLAGLGPLAAVLRPVATPGRRLPGRGRGGGRGAPSWPRPARPPSGAEATLRRGGRCRRLPGRSAAGDRAPHGARQPPHLPARRRRGHPGRGRRRRASASGCPRQAARARRPCPAAGGAAPPLPPGLERTVRGISAFRTPNAQFYRVDTNLTVPRVDVDRLDARGRRRGATGPSR